MASVCVYKFQLSYLMSWPGNYEGSEISVNTSVVNFDTHVLKNSMFVEFSL